MRRQARPLPNVRGGCSPATVRRLGLPGPLRTSFPRNRGELGVYQTVNLEQTATAETQNVHGRGAAYGSANAVSLRRADKTAILTFSARLAAGNPNPVSDGYRGLDSPSGIRAGRAS